MTRTQEIYCFQCLNDNYMECGIYLLPRISCGWEHTNRDASTSYSIFYYLRNFYYICAADLKEYEMQHILMPKALFRDAVRRKEFRVLVSPVVGDNIIEIEKCYEKEHIRYISVKPIHPDAEKSLQKILLNILKKAVSLRADMLVCPEMLGTRHLVEVLSDELGIREEIEDNDFPRMTVCPSIWENRCNSSRILDDMGGTVCEQQKHHGVDLKQWSAKEDIESDRKIYILHCHGIGRIVVAICKDFLITSYLRILAEKLKVNLLLVPSFTGKDYQFDLLRRKYGELDLNVIWINTCASRWLNKDGKMRSFVTAGYFPGKHGVEEVKLSMNDLCGGKQCCEGNCTYIYNIKLS